MLAKPQRFLWAISALTVLGLQTTPLAAHTRITTDVNWANNIRNLLRQHCMRCHSQNGIAPDYADFTTYGTDSRPGARAWATAIEEEILTGRMPPWPADPRFDSFGNSRRLSQQEIDMIVAWTGGGAPQGPRRNLPPPPEFVGDWQLGTPDLVVEPAEPHLVAAGEDRDRVRFSVPIELEQDTWITGYEFRPGHPRSVYRMTAFLVDPPGAEESLEVEVQVPYDPFRDEDEPEPTRWREMPTGRRFLGQWLHGDAPVLFPDTAGRRLRRGSRIEIEVEYRRNELEGSAEEIRDRSGLGLFLAQSEDEVEKIVESTEIGEELTLKGRRGRKPITSSGVLAEDGHLIGLSPSFGDHLASLELRAVYPDDRVRTLLLIPDYRPEWPASFFFAEPVEVAAGTRLEMVGSFRPPAARGGVREPFELRVDYSLDDHLVLPEPLPEPPDPNRPRGGMLTDLFGVGGSDLPVGTPDDPNAAAHMDHSPLHGGQFFMAANQYHHLEGALPEAGEFRLYVYDDFKRPVDPRNFAGRIVFEEFDEKSGEFSETEFELAAVPGTDYLLSRIPATLPSEFFASVWLAGKQTRFDFYFEETTVEPPGGAAYAAAGDVRAGPHSHDRPPLTIPPAAEGIVAAIVERTERLVEMVDQRAYLTLYLPAFDARDLAEALLERLDRLAVRQRGQVRRGVSRVMQSAAEIERAGDLGDEPRLRRALDRYRDGLADILEVYPLSGR